MISVGQISKLNLSTKRTIEILLHSFFVVLIILAYYFNLERTIPFDGAFYSFKIIAYENFNIENNRWGACYNQILPLIGIKLGLALPKILKLYSLSFVLCNYLFFLVIYYGYKQIYTAVGLVLVQVVAYRYNFYYQVSEIHAIIGPVFLLVATLLSEKFTEQSRIKGSLLIFALIFWLMNIHLLSIIIVAFVCAFVFLHKRTLFKNYQIILAIICGIIYFVFKLKTIPTDSYQSQKLISMGNINYVLTHINNCYGFSHFKITWGEQYIFPTILLGFIAVYYLIFKYWLKFLLIIVSVFGFWVLLMAATINIDSPIVYENYYALFGYFIAIPFSIDILSKLRFRWFLPAFTTVVIISIFKIINCGWFMNGQIDYFKRTTNNLRPFKESKFVIWDQNLDWEKIWVPWDFPFQSLLISSLASPDSAMSFVAVNDYSLYAPRIYEDSLTFVGIPWDPYWFSAKGLHKDYFHLKTSYYKKANSFQDTSFNAYVFTKQNMEIALVDNNYKFKSANHNSFPVIIKNKSTQIFRSTTTKYKQVYLGYKVYDTKDSSLAIEGRSIIDVDIYPGQEITTCLRIPKNFIKKGTYSVEVDIVHEYKRWFGLSKWVSLRMK